MALDWSVENYTGADCTGSDGDSNRVLIISNSGTTTNNGIMVKVNELWIKNGEEFSISHNTSGTQITFLNPLWNDMDIIVKYYVRTWGDKLINWKVESLSGSDASGSSGASNRVITLNNTKETTSGGFFVSASGLKLTIDSDYEVSHSASSSQITFLNPLWDDMTVVAKYYEKPDKHTSQYSKVRDDFQEIVLEHGINAYLKRETETTDSMGAISEVDDSFYNIFVSIQDITNKDRQIRDMGIAKPGSAKAFFFHEYPDSVTENGDLTVQTGDMIVTDDDTYRLEQILGKRRFQGQTIFISAIIRKINLD